jgi:molybdenum ABC transporter molybdate-binding protein
VDVFISADHEQMDLVAPYIVAGSRKDVLSNQLAIAVPDDRPRRFTSARDLADPAIARIALGDPAAVPAGVYAKAYLETLGMWDSVAAKIVPMGSVRLALAAVENGAADAAIVYRTDIATARRAREAFVVPPGEGPQIHYPAAAIQGGPNPEGARHFLEFLDSPEAVALFRRAGFVPLGPRRTLVQHRVSLKQLGAITRGTSSTRNDAGLAAVAGALRSLALEQGLPTEPLKALVPVNVRRAHEYGTLGNRVSMTSVWLPLQVSTPGARLEHVHEQTARFKRSTRAEGTQTVISGLSLLPSPLRAPVLRAVAPGRFNLTISSVPGPRSALFIQGLQLEEIYPVIPMAEEQTLSIGMLAYDDHLHFGLYSDPDALPQATRLAELIDDELRALLRARRPRPPLPVVAPATAGPLGTYANRSAVLTAAGPGGHA